MFAFPVLILLLQQFRFNQDHLQVNVDDSGLPCRQKGVLERSLSKSSHIKGTSAFQAVVVKTSLSGDKILCPIRIPYLSALKHKAFCQLPMGF